MHKSIRIYFTGDGPFSSINTWTTTIGMANYFQLTGRSDIHDQLINSLLQKEVTMTLQEKIKSDLKVAILARDPETADALKVIISELQRAETKELSDDAVIRVLKKLEKSESELLEATGASGSSFMDTVKRYLPQMATEQDIEVWIKENVDFSKFKNKMQAVGVVMKHFGSTADGNVVRKIIQEM